MAPADSLPVSEALCDYLTQRSRPQLFSNALPCTIAGSSMAALKYLRSHPELVSRLRSNTEYFRAQLLARGFKPLAGDTPIIPVILGETSKAIQMSNMLLDNGVFVTGFGYPVVPKGEARVRCQISAAHTREHSGSGTRCLRHCGAKARTGVIAEISPRLAH